jgi:hypothetical protein
MDTIACLERKDTEERLALERRVEGLAQGQPEQARVGLTSVWRTFKAFESADAGWAYDEWISGTRRWDFALGQARFDRAQFAELLERVVGQRQLGVATARELGASEQVTIKLIGRHEKAWLEHHADDLMPHVDAARYRSSRENAQRAWRNYRDAWLELAAAIPGGGRPGRRRWLLKVLLDARAREMRERTYNPQDPNTERP